MASFRTHVVCGGIWGVAAGTAAFLAGWCGMVQSVALGILAMIGAALPDIDSRSGRPRRILLGILGVGIPVLLVGSGFLRKMTTEALFCWMIALYIAIRYGADFLLSRFSHHRGAFHSIPAGLLTGETVYLIFHDSALHVRFAFALAAGGGYLSHLLLDELCSWNFVGANEKASVGTAFTWNAGSIPGNLLLYAAVLAAAVFCVLTPFPG